MHSEIFLQFANALREPLLLVTSEGTILVANRESGKRLGIAPQELSGKPLESLVIDPVSQVTHYLQICSRTRETVPGSLNLQDAEGKILACRCEGAVVIPRHDEVPAVVQLRLIPKEEANSQFVLLNQRIDALTREIAARKRAEEELVASNLQLQRAISETHHRVKNNLQTVSSLLEMQKIEAPEGTFSTEALNDSLLQIKTIALVHDLLSHDRPLEKVDVEQVLKNLVSLLSTLLPVASKSVKFHLEAESLFLPTKAATALALTVNELISNSLKHGVSLTKEPDNGRIVIRLSRQQGGICLEVEDSGPGFPRNFNPATDASIGLELVQSLVKIDLQGTLFFGHQEISDTKGLFQRGGKVTVFFPEHPLSE